MPDVTAPWFQKLQLEYLLSTPNDVYIASGGGWDAGGRPAIGPGLDSAKGREGLRRLTEERDLIRFQASGMEGSRYLDWSHSHIAA